MLAGITGVPLGSYIAQQMRHRFPAVDPHICAYGLIISAPLVFLSLITSTYNTTLCMLLIFSAQLSLNLTWSIVADILLVRNHVVREKKEDLRSWNDVWWKAQEVFRYLLLLIPLLVYQKYIYFEIIKGFDCTFMVKLPLCYNSGQVIVIDTEDIISPSWLIESMMTSAWQICT